MKVTTRAAKKIREIPATSREKETILLPKGLKDNNEMPTKNNHLIKVLQGATPNRK